MTRVPTAGRAATSPGPPPAPRADPSHRPDLGAAPSTRPCASARWRAIRALVVRDLAGRHPLRPPLLLDLGFGLVNLVVFLVISRLLAPDPGFAGSPSYFDFVAAGLVFMLVLQAASTQLTARISREQRAGTLEMLVAQPVPAWALALGLTGYPMLFALLRVAVYLTVLALFLGLDTGDASWIGVTVVLVAACAAMAGVGIALMAVTVLTGHGDAAARLLVVALSFVSGTYFPVTVLPAGLERVSAALPTRVALDGLRAALAGDGWARPAGTLLVAAAVSLPVSGWLFDLALRTARRRGGLTRG
ncbi:ABC transporter permease [Micromonospora echinospora]|uniref:ABC transporter permease n=1 Tax=Micromonospora echinospora TaxID=1877 RepID=UPI003A84810A